MRVLVAGNWMWQIREGRQERTSIGWLYGVRVYAVSYNSSRAVRSEAWVNQRKSYSCDCSNFEVDNVVSYSAPIREACGISCNEPQTIRAACVRCYCHVEPQIICLDTYCEVLEAGHNSRRYACSEDSDKVRSWFA